jgi:hypothetical protein
MLRVTDPAHRAGVVIEAEIGAQGKAGALTAEVEDMARIAAKPTFGLASSQCSLNIT